MTMGGGANRFKRIGAMENVVVETDEDFLTFDIPDEALERAAVVTAVQVTTIGVCTYWYPCSWPQ